jgi:HD-like signal output (HDOD) protein
MSSARLGFSSSPRVSENPCTVSESAGLNEDIVNIVDSLPVAPRILAELAPKLQQTSVDLVDVATLIRRDGGLTARLIAAANSVAYVGSEPSASLEDAIARIGYRETYRIIGAVASAHLADEPLHFYGIKPQRLRENSLFVALVMEELAGSIDLDPRSAYTVGLLRSVGKIVLDRYARLTDNAVLYDPTEDAMSDWELQNLGHTGSETSAHVLTTWRFPAETALAVMEHYHPNARSPLASHLLNLAAGTAQACDFGFAGEESYWQFTDRTFALTRLDRDELTRVGECAKKALGRISAALA